MEKYTFEKQKASTPGRSLFDAPKGPQKRNLPATRTINAGPQPPELQPRPPQFPNPPGGRSVLEQLNFQQSFQKLEYDLLGAASYYEASAEAQRMRTLWACITAKSQRRKKTRELNPRFIINQYSNLTEIKPEYPEISGGEPPAREGETIQEFTKRSRQRLMAKARRLNKETLPVPWFVTLTYHKNFTDCETAKDHLNAFLQRWRRRGNCDCPEDQNVCKCGRGFHYFWKMEPQKRGAVHFHLALFIPESQSFNGVDFIDYDLNLKPENEKKMSPRHKKLIKIISTDWAEVTKEIDGYKSRYSRIKYFNKGGRVSRAALEEREGFHIDWAHLRGGTNVRKCENWKQFLAYCYKYMGKDLKKYPFGPPRLPGVKITTGPAQPPRPPLVEKIPIIEQEPVKTGRFWGFSTNLDFSALQTGIIDLNDLNAVNELARLLNDECYKEYLQQAKENRERARQKYSGRKLNYELNRINNGIRAQKRRYAIQVEKIGRGYMLQFEVSARKSGAALAAVGPDSLADWHKPPPD